MTGAMIIQTGEDSFIIAGTGVVITFKLKEDKSLNIGILSTEEGSFVENEWIMSRRMKGDQIHQDRHIRLPEGSFSMQQFELYTYE